MEAWALAEEENGEGTCLSALRRDLMHRTVLTSMLHILRTPFSQIIDKFLQFWFCIISMIASFSSNPFQSAYGIDIVDS